MQQSIFDLIPADDQMFEIGDEVWRVTIDVVERFFVSGTFDCKDYALGDGSKTVRYHLSKLFMPGDGIVDRLGTGQSFDTIGKYDIGDRFFRTPEEAQAKAAENLLTWKVMRGHDMEPVECIGYEMDGRAGKLTATFAILPGNIVYRKSWYSYGIANRVESAWQAARSYEEWIAVSLKEGASGHESEPLECRPTFEDVYSIDGDRWGSAGYALRNFAKEDD